MPKHQHQWVEAQRLDGNVMQERCACGEKRERDMTKAETADYAAWKTDMARLDQEGDHHVA